MNDLWQIVQRQTEEIARLRAEVRQAAKPQQPHDLLAATGRSRDPGTEDPRPARSGAGASRVGNVAQSWSESAERGSRRRRLSRAGLVKAAAIGVAGIAGAEVFPPRIAAADNTGPYLDLGQANDATNTTALYGDFGSTVHGPVLLVQNNSLGDGLQVTGAVGNYGYSFNGITAYGGASGPVGSSSPAGNGVIATGGSQGGQNSVNTPGAGVIGIGGSASAGQAGQFSAAGVVALQGYNLSAWTISPFYDAALFASTNVSGNHGLYAIGGPGGHGVFATTSDGQGYAIQADGGHGVGVYTQSSSGYGVHAIGFPGFLAEGATLNGANGRGGRFISQQAQIRLNPATASMPPASGQAAGDFFVASDGALYYCKDGTQWHQIV